MTKIKEQAVEILLDIPDHKIVTVIEILKGLRSLCNHSENKEKKTDTASSVMGIFNKYANLDLASQEKEAWGEAVKEKHVIH